MPQIDVLIPTYRRVHALAITLTSLISQTFRDFRIVISDQTEDADLNDSPELQAVLRVLRFHGHPVELHKHLPRRGLAEHRQFLLDQAHAPYLLFSDDDLIYEPDALERMLTAIQQYSCGFVGCSVPGLSYLKDVRPHQQTIQFWHNQVIPETIRPNSAEWERYPLHNAANIIHVAQNLALTPSTQQVYRVAWVGGCVLYDTEKLRKSGGFQFWQQLPDEHCGEDVYAQIRVMEQFGGCGLIPTRVYHQEVPTTVVNRAIDAPKVLQY